MTLQASGGADTGFDTTPITATVKPALATPRETVEAGFDELGGSPASVQQATPTLDTVADMGKPKDANADLDARVAALLPDKPTTDWNAVTAFMGAVVPWPASASDPGWINLVNGYVSRKVPGGRLNGKYPIGHGSPYKDLGKFVADVGRNNSKPTVKDQFFCLSLQRDHGPKTQSGFVQAARSASAALAVKAIWIDVDVRQGRRIPDGRGSSRCRDHVPGDCRPPAIQRHRWFGRRHPPVLDQRQGAYPRRMETLCRGPEGTGLARTTLSATWSSPPTSPASSGYPGTFNHKTATPAAGATLQPAAGDVRLPD